MGLRDRFPAMRRKRIRTPTVLQMEAAECGAAALSIMLYHYGRYVPLEELRVACGVSRDGSKASNILKAARTYGLIAKGYTKDVAGLRAMRLPVIVFWQFNHFLVVEGFSKKRVYLNDPASGPRSVSHAEFDESFPGVVLTLEKGPDFRKGGRQPSAIRGLRARLPGNRLGILYVSAAALALTVPGMVVPAFTRVFIDEVLIGKMISWLQPLLAIMIVTAIVTAILTYLQQRALLRLDLRLSITGSGGFLRHVLRLPMSFFLQRNAGDISSRVGLNDRLAAILSGEMASVAVSLLMIGLFAPLLYQYDLTLTLLGIGFAALNLLVLKLVSRTLADRSGQVQRESNKLAGVSMTGLIAVESIKAGGGEYDFFSKWAGHYAKAFNSSQKLAVAGITLGSIAPFLSAVNGVAILTVGGHRVMDGVLTMGMLIGFQGLMGSFIGPVNHLMGLGPRLQEARADITQLDDVLQNEVDPLVASVGSEASVSHRLTGYLELRDIEFGYSRLGPPLISGFNLKLKPGDRVALVGGSGSGKSTISKIVCGVYEPWKGEVLLDGKPRASWPRNVISNSLAFVDQDILLFEGTARKNLTLWDPTVDETDLVQAAKDAAIHGDIMQRLNGYDHFIQEGGRNFSGGQRQRLEIARALATNPRIVVLDEATSALDPKTEKIVDDNLRRRGCTCLIVAHRLSTIRDCDEIIVMERGKVVQRGTHAELMRHEGPYSRLTLAS